MEENKNILIIGHGASTSALANKFSSYEEVGKIYIASGNTVTNDKWKNVDIREDDLTGLLKFALENEINLTIPISELSLKSDIVSFFQSNGQYIFGPVANACNFAINNAAGKKLLYKIHAQTSKFGIFDKMPQAQDWLKNAKFPVTIKTNQYNGLGDRLVCPTISLANEFLENLFTKGEISVLTEEYTFGHNFTIYFITDGYSAIPITSVGKYKFEQDGDGGILTNGVGCYAPDYKISETILSRVSNVVRNILTSLEKKGFPYMGILGVDCTITGEDKFYINEFKPFLQDFDTKTVLDLIDENLVKVFMACIEGLFADEYEQISTNEQSSISAVVSAKKEGVEIKGFDMIDNLDCIDFINVKKSSEKYLTTKGQNFVITKSASTLNRAKTYLYDDLSELNFDGIKYRKDIAKCN